MRILVTNDDGIFAPGLWRLVKELSSIAEVVVVAPDREQSAIGTAVTLRQPLRVQQVTSIAPEIEAYSVEGTPSDCTILALDKLGKIDLVVSGINQGVNLGDDVLISGTVGAALQGYLRGLSAIAISIDSIDSPYLDNAARVAARLARGIISNSLPTNVFLNVNLPSLPLSEIKGVEITRLAGKSHIDAAEEGHDGKRKYYWLVRRKVSNNAGKETDLWAVEQGNISITPLHAIYTHNSSPPLPPTLYSDLLQELQEE
jgi:5'-nucleotidase